MKKADRILADWLRAHAGNIKNQKDAAMSMMMLTPESFDSPDLMLQIGAAICLNKPICLILLRGCVLPPKLERVADKVLVSSGGPDMADIREELGEWLTEQTEKLNATDNVSRN
jgi:hypothetical protein